MKHKIFLRLGATLLLLSVLACLAGCGAGTVRASSNASEVVATAGEIEILYDEYYYLAMTRIRELKAAHGEDALSDPAVREELESFLATNLLTESHALRALGLSYGIDVEEGSIADSVKSHMEGILEETFEGDRDAYIESLRADYLTDRYVRTFVAVENYLAVEIIKEMLQRGELDSSDDAVMARLQSDDFIRVRQVLIENKYSGGAEKAKQKAEALRATVAAATTDESRDAAMIKAMAQSLDFSDVGDGLYFARGEMKDAFEEVSFSLPLYGVSEVIEVDGGYTFVMRLPKVQSYLEKNLETLKTKSYFLVLNEKLGKWMDSHTAELTEFGKSLDPTALEVIEPDGGEGIFTVIWVGAVVVGVLVTAWVVRVLLLRRSLKKGKLPMKKSTRNGSK